MQWVTRFSFVKSCDRLGREASVRLDLRAGYTIGPFKTNENLLYTKNYTNTNLCSVDSELSLYDCWRWPIGIKLFEEDLHASGGLLVPLSSDLRGPQQSTYDDMLWRLNFHLQLEDLWILWYWLQVFNFKKFGKTRLAFQTTRCLRSWRRSRCSQSPTCLEKYETWAMMFLADEALRTLICLH